MWAPILLCLVGLTSAKPNSFGWNENHEYQYKIRGRTLTGLHQVADQYSGVFLQGQLRVHAASENQLFLQVEDLRYADYNGQLSKGWSSNLGNEQVSLQSVPVKGEPFQLNLKNGVIQNMQVNKNLPSWEVNLYKSIASLLQVDTQGQNVKKSNLNIVPENGQDFGVFKTMEDSVNGEYETIYDINPLPEYVIQSRPELAPLPHLRGEGQFIDVAKTRNFSNSQQHFVYRFGANGREGWKAGTNQMGNFVSRSSVSRIILSGHVNDYTIHSSVTTEKVILAPHLYNGQKGIVVSSMNLTLSAVTPGAGSQMTITEPRTIESLVYEPQNQNGNNWHSESSEWQQTSSESSSSSSENSSSSPSSEEDNMSALEKKTKNKKEMKSRKDSFKQNSSGSSSSSSSSSDSSSSSGSSEEILPRNPELNQPPEIEFHPYYFKGWGSKRINLIGEIQKLAQNVGQWIQGASQMQSQNTLDKFALLTQLVAVANYEQLQAATQILYFNSNQTPQLDNKEESGKYQAWVAFVDAVAESGTGPALKTIKDWIESNKIQGEQAAQVLAVLPNAARYPTTEYMNFFFNAIVMNQQMLNKNLLNTSALISFTELVRKSQVDTETSENRFSTNLFGKNAEGHKKPVTEAYIPWLEKQLQKAVSEGDSIKIQVYIRALGNIAHPKILAVFKPYLEGRRPMSGFQRLTIIASLDELAWVHPNRARDVLFRVYENTAESAEVRVAAVMQLMKTNPPAQMLQRMAEFTNYDTSRQVNAAVKSAIESAAYNMDASVEWSAELSQNARSAVNLLTPKNYGLSYSRNYMRSFLQQQQDLQYQQYFSYIQGHDSAVPSSAIYNINRRIGGYGLSQRSLAIYTSSAEDLNRLFRNKFQFQGQSINANNGQGSGSQYTYENIFNNLNLQTDEQEQVEGNIYHSLFGAKRFIPFDNHTVDQLPNLFNQLQEQFQNGANLQYTKFYNKYAMELGFPLAMGLPFFYSAEESALASWRGQWKGYVQQQQTQQGFDIPIKAGVEGKLQVTQASQKRGKMGFAVPFNNQQYVAVLNKDYQLYLPLEGKVQFNPEVNGIEAQLQPFQQANENQQVLYHGSTAFTAIHNLHNIQPYTEGNNVKRIHVRQPQTFQKTLGLDETGYAFDIQVKSEYEFMDLASFYNEARKHDFISYILHNDISPSFANSYISVSYNPRKSNPQGVRLLLSYLSDEQGKQSPSKMVQMLRDSISRKRSEPNDNGNAAQPRSYENRREELFNNAQQGIQDAFVQMLDAAVLFGGENSDMGYSLTFAHANSPVSQNSRALLYYHGKPMQTSQNARPFQAAFQLNFNVPQVPIFNYQEAINADPTTHIDGQVNLQGGANSESSQITLKGKLQRTQQRKQYLQQSPLAQLCERQMENGNYIQAVCRNITARANYLDNYQFNINYKNLPTGLERALYQLYSLARYTGFQYVKEQVVEIRNPEGQLHAEVQFARNLQSVNVSIQAPNFAAQFENVKVPYYAVPLVVYHPAYNQLNLLSQSLFNSQHYVTAVIDGNRATTFDNRSYPIELGNCYHVLAMYAPHEPFDGRQDFINQNQQQNFAILIKQTGQNQKHVKIVLGNDNIDLKAAGSSGFSVQANGQQIQLQQNSISRWSNNNNELLALQLQQNLAMLYFPQNGFQLLYDGARVKLSVSPTYRNRIRGLVGTYNGDKVDEFTLPNNRVLGNPLLFSATYALTQDSACQGPAKQRQQEALQAPSYEKRYIYGNVISENDIRRKDTKEKSNNVTKHTNQEGCTSYRVKVLERNGKTCFSLRPQVECNSRCKPSNSIQKTIDFHCMESSGATRHWVSKVKSGGDPGFAHKGSNYKETISLPETCVPK